MNYSKYFSILFCTISMLMISACEKSEIHKSTSVIEDRSDCVDECTDCPLEDCCCSIELTSMNSINLTFCGVTDPCLSSIPCGPTTVNGCTISGYELYSTLTSMNPTTLFCVDKNSAFYITSTGQG